MPNGSGIKHPDKFFINGQWVTPSSDASVTVVTPSTEEIFVCVAEARAADIDRAVASARHAFDNGPWSMLPHAERASYLMAIAGEIQARSAQLIKIWVSESGVVANVAQAVVPGMVGALHYYASLAKDFPFEERHPSPAGGKPGLLVREPVGVVAAIIPWNSPLSLTIHKVAPALLAGCTVIVKASPEAPGAAYVLAEIIEAVGLPAGVFNMLTADREVSELLVRHAGIDKVSFTGSTAAGRRIASICGERIARCTLELGGKSAAIVLDDYDLNTVARSLSGSARLLTGQVCASLTRVVVNRKRHDALVDALSTAFDAIKIGDPFDMATEMGPLAMKRQRDRVEHYIAIGQAEGATLATGGRRPAHLYRGFYIEPTVFGHVDNNMIIAREEIFGPVVCVIPADSEEHSVTIANDTIFGLNASVFTNDSQRAYSVARQLRSGTVGHNGFRTDFSIGFGGFKQSGIGREGGSEGLRPFLETKTIIMESPLDQVMA